MGWWEKLITDDVGQRNAKQVSWDTPSFKKTTKVLRLNHAKTGNKNEQLVLKHCCWMCMYLKAMCEMCGMHPGRVCAVFPVADPEERPGGPASPLFFDQNEARRAEKSFLETGPPTYLRVWMTRSPPLFIWRSGSVTVSYDREGFPTKTAHLLGRL